MKKRFLITAFVVAFSSATIAHAIVGRAFELATATNATAGTTADSVTIAGNPNQDARGILLRLEANNDSGSTPTLDVTVQHSPDCSTWKDLASFTQVTTETSNVEDIHLTEATTVVFACLRAVITMGGSSPQYDYTVTAYVD